MSKHVVVIGGDKRELEVMSHLVNLGYAVTACLTPAAALPDGVMVGGEPLVELAQADACILPVPPLQENGIIHTMLPQMAYLDDHSFVRAEDGLPVLTGIVTPHLRCIAAQCVLIGLLDEEEIARPLAEATAEGAVAEAVRLSEDLLYGAQALIIGYGRIGRALAWRLEALGMNVVVLNRSEERAEEARDYGLTVGDWSQLTAIAAQSPFIFNTAPAPVLNRDQLRWLKRDTLVIDLAAKPGGTDFAAAAELGVKAVLAGGLPGKYAPRFSGRVMAEVYARRLAQVLGEEEK